MRTVDGPRHVVASLVAGALAVALTLGAGPAWREAFTTSPPAGPLQLHPDMRMRGSNMHVDPSSRDIALLERGVLTGQGRTARNR